MNNINNNYKVKNGCKRLQTVVKLALMKNNDREIISIRRDKVQPFATKMKGFATGKVHLNNLRVRSCKVAKVATQKVPLILITGFSSIRLVAIVLLFVISNH